MVRKHQDRRNNDRRCGRYLSPEASRGFSLLEMMFVVLIVLIMCSVGFITLQPLLQRSHVNMAYNSVLASLRLTRQMSIDDRKTYFVVLLKNTAPHSFQVWRQDGGTPVPPPVLLNTYQLPQDVQFDAEPGIPSAPNTPDNFGNGLNAIDLDANNAAGVNSIYFKPDGGSYDQLGRMANGVVYVAMPGKLGSSLAISVYGVTGRVKGWRLTLNQTSGVWSWQPQ